MSAPLYGRYASCTVAPIDGTPGLDVSQLRINFETEKTSTSEANKATVKIYNLSKENRGKIKAKKQAVILDAGYEQLHSVIIAGVIQRLEHHREGADIISEMEVRDGGLGLDAGEFRKSYPANTSKLTIIYDILASMPDLTKGPILASGLAGAISSKLCFSGSSRAAMDKLARAWKFEWSAQDGSVQILNRTQTTNPQTLAVFVSSETGLIGSPTRTDKGAKFKTLLMGHVRPGTLINLESEFVTTALKALTVKHSGDTRGREWSTETEAKDLLGTPVQHMKKPKAAKK